MSNSNRDFIADVMSGDEAQNSNPATHRNYEFSDDETVVAGGEDATLSNLLTESEAIVRSLSNLSIYRTNAMDDKDFERKPWQSLSSLRPHQSSLMPIGVRSGGTSDYVSDELASGARSHRMLQDSRSHLYSNQNQIQTFSDTASLLQTLKDELVTRTSELHRTENEYFNLKANFENLNGRLECTHHELSTLRTQNYSKDKQIKLLTEKVASLNFDASMSRENCEVAKSELEKVRLKLEQCDQSSDLHSESLSKEVKRRDEVIDQLRTELTESSRTNRTSRNSELSEGQLKEKQMQFENAIKTKEQKILAQQRQIVEYEHEIQGLREINAAASKTKSDVGQLQEEMELLKEQLANARNKNDSINETLVNSKKFYDEFKGTSEKSMQDYAKMTQKLKNDYRELEEKHRESLATLKQRGDMHKRLNDDIKELTDKLRCMENLVSEKDKGIHLLNLEKIENHQKIESLRSQLVEGSITETNVSLSFKKEVESKQNYIDQLSKETIQLNRSIDELEDKMRIRDSTIEQLNKTLVDTNGFNSALKKSLQNVEETVYQLTNRERMLDQINKENENRIELLQMDIKNGSDQLESVRDQLDKTSMEKRDLERNSQRKEERILQENEERAHEMESLKLELKKVTQLLSIEQESSRHLSGEVDKLAKEYSKLNKDFEQVSDELESKDTSYNELSEKESRLLNHNSYLEEELTKMKLALEDSGDELERIRKSWDSREDALAICNEELSRQKANNLELITKIEQRDQLLQSLTTETGKLKQKYQNRNTELTKLSSQNVRLKESLQEVENSMSGMNHKYEEMKNKKDKEIHQFKTELEELQNQYSNCYDELVQKQELCAKCQTMERESALKMTKLQEEMSQQQIDYDEMESELNILRAKHRACQEELSRRDEDILTLRSELQHYQRDVLSFQSERPTFQKEIERWREKFSELQDKLQDRLSQSDSLEDSISEKEHKIDELLSELQVKKQENANQSQIIEQLKADVTLLKSTNSDRYNHFQAIIESLKAEAETKNQEARFLEDNCSKYRNEICKLKSELENVSLNVTATNEQVDHYKERLQSKEDECQHWIEQTQRAQYLNEEVKVSLDSLEREITQHKQQLDVKESKLRSQSDTIIKLKNEKNQHYKSFIDCQRQLDMCSKDKSDAEKSSEENIIKVKKYEKCIRDLNEELSEGQIEMSNLSNRLVRLESELSQSSLLTNQKQSTLETLECKLAKMKANLSNYKTCHKTEDTEVENLNSLLLQHTKKYAELEDALNCRNKERDMLMVEKEKKDKEMSELNNTFMSMKSDIDNLRRDREEKRCQLEDLQKKYQYEIKKVKTYSKEVEEDIGSLHRTIDDLQRQIDCKDILLDKANEKGQAMDLDLELKRKEIVHFEERLREYEIDKRHYDSLVNTELGKQSVLQKEVHQLQEEVKESRLLILQLTNDKTKFETKCTSLETMLEKAERKVSQTESELKKLQSTFFVYSRELDELRQQHQSQAMVLERTKEEYGRFTDEYQALKGEKINERKKSTVIGGEIESLKLQISNNVQNIAMLTEQVEQQEAIIIELQNELLQERKKVVDLHNNEYQKKKALNEMETETDNLSRTRHDLKNKLKEKERLVSAKQNENDRLTSKIRQLTESMIEKDNKIKIFEKKMQAMEEEKSRMKQAIVDADAGPTSPRHGLSDRSDYVSQLESAIADNQSQMDQLRSEIRLCTSKNYELSLDRQMMDEDIQRLKQEKAALHARLSSFPPRQEDMFTLNSRKTQFLEEESDDLHKTIKMLRFELEEKDQLLLKKHDDSIMKLTSKLDHVEHEQDLEKSKMSKLFRNDLESRIKEIVELQKVIEKITKGNELLTLDLERSENAIRTLQSQNTAVVDNFNVWVQEQKVANERLGDKIREQTRAIHELRKEKEQILREKLTVRDSLVQNGAKDISSSSSSYSEDKIALENQLRSMEENQEKIVQAKNKIIEELQRKVTDQIREIMKLKQQILIEQNEHQNMKIEIDRARIAADSSKARISAGLDRNGKSEDKDMMDGAEANDSRDKRYWIQRVGQLTDELQQCRDYWSDKVRLLSNNIETSSTATDDTLTPISSKIT